MRLILGLLLLQRCSAQRYFFSPEQDTEFEDPELPAQYSLQASQLTPPAASLTSSFWFASYLTTLDDRQYVVLSQAFALPDGVATFRASILDIDHPEKYWSYIESRPLLTASPSVDGRLIFDAGDFAVEGVSKDSISEMLTRGSTSDFAYNLTIRATSRVILNAGTGHFDWGTGNTTQWSLPSCATSGTLLVEGKAYDVDETRSLTWYDRQHGIGGPSVGFTWFGIQFPNSEVKASVWFSDSTVPKDQHLRFATVRTKHGLEIIRFTMTTYPLEVWTSPRSNNTYSKRWMLEFSNGDVLNITSVRDDQEPFRDGELAGLSAFASVEGSFFGQSGGFALVDVVPTSNG
ncbi:hypothetical protein C7974DRAFT_399987 [Boeremia exigua]|uniref:uncharacterized protein n=1 Tax=Boeremia exigua TaxID=749465 RepID=UPI001E8CECDC|nr:uncharacterized protein C7974DRAFT_399987 [Boeremia exigua]KAH6620566.1 hypothetical protein C7974DRAFT_399987 [Boeremia exigua]